MSTNFCCNDAGYGLFSVPGIKAQDINVFSVGRITIRNPVKCINQCMSEHADTRQTQWNER